MSQMRTKPSTPSSSPRHPPEHRRLLDFPSTLVPIRYYVSPRLPERGALLLQTERDAAGLAVILENHHFDTVADHVDLRRVADAAPRHIGDVEEPVDPAEVHESAVICDVLDGAVHELAFGEVRQGPLPALVARFLEQEPAGHDHVAAPLVDLDDLHGEGLADELFGVTHRMQVDLGAGQEGFHADVHHHSALDAADDPAFDDGLLFVDPLQVFPDLHLVRLLRSSRFQLFKRFHSPYHASPHTT